MGVAVGIEGGVGNRGGEGRGRGRVREGVGLGVVGGRVGESLWK